FFQAEDGIRDPLVTGVQTCALPIWGIDARAHDPHGMDLRRGATVRLPIDLDARRWHRKAPGSSCSYSGSRILRSTRALHLREWRSEERRVGKGWRYGW